MSNFSKGDWCDTFDALYWNFIIENKDKLVKNSRMLLMLKLLEKKDETEKEKIIKRALEFYKTFK
jgi:deoxyribodipyrimidine photolyase-related protein